MKKLVLLAASALTAGVVKRKLDAQEADRRLWAEATGSSSSSSSSETAAAPVLGEAAVDDEVVDDTPRGPSAGE